MRLVFDLQACQIENTRERGIGRYSMALLREIVRQRDDDDIRVTLNAGYEKAARKVVDDLRDLLPESAFSFYRAPPVEGRTAEERAALREIGSRIARHHHATLSPDLVHSSLPVGFGEAREATLRPPEADGAGTAPYMHAATLYDLIPLVFDDVYLADPERRAAYERDCAALADHDLLLAISGATRRDAIERLGIAPERVVTVMGAADPIFRPLDTGAERRRIARTYGIERPYVLYTGGVDFRKNVDAALEAFARLPEEQRTAHAFVVVCRVSPADRRHLEDVAGRLGIADALVVTGFVPDSDLVALYNGCTLFCFPTLYEGFGLPALEAMACGAPTIASNNSSMPELLGREDATFDAADPDAIARKMGEALGDPDFREDLRRSGLERAAALNWSQTARTALSAMRAAVERHRSGARDVIERSDARPRIVMATPLPPQQSGIAVHTQKILPHLRDVLDIGGLFDGASLDRRNGPHPVQRPFDELEAALEDCDLAIYQMGNSEFHTRMIAPLERHGGVLVLHDVFLSDIVEWMSQQPDLDMDYRSRIAAALPPDDPRFPRSEKEANERSPANREILSAADGIVVHSRSAAALIARFFPDLTAPRIEVIGLARETVEPDRAAREAARERLGIAPDEVLGVHLGIVNGQKCCAELLTAVERVCAADPAFRFAFVGRSVDAAFDAAWEASEFRSRIQVTGFVDADTLEDHLRAADLAVQLRLHAHGESSLAVLDCMAHALPTIVNAIGSFEELPDDAVSKIDASVDIDELERALTKLSGDAERRREIGEAARLHLLRHHAPDHVARRYREVVETFLRDRRARDWERCLDELREPLQRVPDRAGAVASDLAFGARALRLSAQNRRFLRERQERRRLLVDVSQVYEKDHETGIQRVVRNLARSLQDRDEAGGEPFTALPFALSDGNFVVPVNYVSGSRDGAPDGLPDGAIGTGDDVLMVDSSWIDYTRFGALFDAVRRHDGRVFTVVYDLVPLLHPEVTGEQLPPLFDAWLRRAALVSDGLICISRAVADEVIAYLDEHDWPHRDGLKIGWWHLGSDLPPRVDHERVREEIETTLASDDPTFLMVGTIEPRKRHAVALDAMERLWAQGGSARLILLGKEGWRVEDLAERLRRHPERGKRLFWFTDVTDAEIALAYQRTDALVFASIYEGYGLPIVEAARAGLPAIVSDIPVLREVGGDGVATFRPDDADALADVLEDFTGGRLTLDAKTTTTLSWAQSVDQLLDVIYADRWYATLRR